MTDSTMSTADLDRLSEAATAEGLSLEAYLRRCASKEPTPEVWAERGARAREILKAWNGYDPTPEEEAKLDEHLDHQLAEARRRRG